MLRHLLPCLLLLACLSCSPARSLRRSLQRDPAYSDHVTGFALYDPTARRLLLQHNANLYFTPASNTKLFSFYAGLMTLGDSLPALRYVVRHDSLLFQGTGNPLLLNPDVPDTAALRFLRNRPEKLFMSVANFSGERLGPGWAWDDYNDDYSAEVAPFPIYGNVVRFSTDASGNLRVSPQFFADSVRTAPGQEAGIHRTEATNQFTRPVWKKAIAQDVPYRWSPELAARLLADRLHKPVQLTSLRLPAGAATVYGDRPADSLYKRMLMVSDNMLAEHLMLLCASVGDTVSSTYAIQQAIRQHLADLPDRPVWVDGSGLSRYNLFTPRSLTALLAKIYAKVPQQRLFSLLPAAGKSGTIRSLTTGDTPYIYAKSGSMTGVYNLSGYLVTKRGRVLLFSMMHNNFTQPVSEIRRRTGAFLGKVREQY